LLQRKRYSKAITWGNKSIAPFRNDPHLTMRETRRSTGLLPLGLAGMEKTPVAELEKTLHSILATLETCRAALVASDSRETAQLVSVAILELRMKLNQITDAELKALCDAMLSADARAASAQDRESQYAPRQRPLLRLVK